MVSTPEGFNDNITISPIQSEPNKKFSAIKPIRQFLEALDFKHKADVCRLCDATGKIKAGRTGNALW